MSCSGQRSEPKGRNERDTQVLIEMDFILSIRGSKPVVLTKYDLYTIGSK